MSVRAILSVVLFVLLLALIGGFATGEAGAGNWSRSKPHEAPKRKPAAPTGKKVKLCTLSLAYCKTITMPAPGEPCRDIFGYWVCYGPPPRG